MHASLVLAEDALAQCTGRWGHFLDLECFERLDQDREASREDRAPVPLQPLELEAVRPLQALLHPTLFRATNHAALGVRDALPEYVALVVP